MAVDYTKRHLMDGLAGIPQVARQREALAYPGYLNATAPFLTIGRVLGTNPVPRESLPFAQIPWEISQDQCAIDEADHGSCSHERLQPRIQSLSRWLPIHGVLPAKHRTCLTDEEVNRFHELLIDFVH